jgi:WD40 repeat protein
MNGQTRKAPNKGKYLSPDGHLILVLGKVGADNAIWVGDLTLGKAVASATLADDIGFSADFALDGSATVLGGHQGAVQYFDLDRQKGRRWAFNGEGRAAVGVAADGRKILVACESRGLHLRDPDSGKLIRMFEGKPGLIWSIAFSPDSRYALTAGDDRLVRLWDIAKGCECHRFEGHTAAVRQVAFTADGKQALSASMDGSTT